MAAVVCGGVWLAAAPATAADPAACKASDGNPAQLVADCDAALALPADPKTRSAQFYARAYAKNAQNNNLDALPDLNDAVRLDPTNASAFHERGFTLGGLGDYEAAIADLNTELTLRPGFTNAYMERAFSEFPLGRFQAAYDDRDRVARAKPADGFSLTARAEAGLWLGLYDKARADLDAADALAKTQANTSLAATVEEDRKLLALWTTTSGVDPEKACQAAEARASKGGQPAFNEPNLIGDCTAAFFKAITPNAKANALWVRAEAWLVGRQDQGHAYTDTVITVALEPDNPDWRVNLGSALVMSRHSWAAIKQLDKAIALKPSYPAYAERASARYNRHDMKGAFEDAKKSFEMQPNSLALVVLGDVAQNEFHDPKAAKDYWMGAYQLGGRDDGLIERLKSVGVEAPDKATGAAPTKPL